MKYSSPFFVLWNDVNSYLLGMKEKYSQFNMGFNYEVFISEKGYRLTLCPYENR